MKSTIITTFILLCSCTPSFQSKHTTKENELRYKRIAVITKQEDSREYAYQLNQTKLPYLNATSIEFLEPIRIPVLLEEMHHEKSREPDVKKTQSIGRIMNYDAIVVGDFITMNSKTDVNPTTNSGNESDFGTFEGILIDVTTGEKKSVKMMVSNNSYKVFGIKYYNRTEISY